MKENPAYSKKKKEGKLQVVLKRCRIKIERGEAKEPSSTASLALQTMRDLRLMMLWTEYSKEEGDEENDKMDGLNPLHVGRLSFSFTENGWWY